MSPLAPALVRVAVERGVDAFPDGLTYSVPASLEPVAAGERVLVPLGRGNRTVAGYVVATGDAATGAGASLDLSRIKPISGRDPSGAAVPGEVLALARWISSYYCAPIGVTIASILPAAVRRNVGRVSRTFVDIAAEDGRATDDKGGTTGDEGGAGADGAEPGARGSPRLPRVQRAVMDALRALAPEERPIDIDDLLERAGAATKGPVQALAKAGLVTLTQRSSVEARWAAADIHRAQAPEPTLDQMRVIDAVGGTIGAGFSQHLLFGVTGAGKTEVYIRLVQRALASGKSAIVLVPEISLTPQTMGRLVSRLPEHRVCILHSALTAAQRHEQWERCREPGPKVVLGARSAIFAPLPDGELGLVIVDEEHDHSYKQDQAPRYHGRDVAIRRAQLVGCPVLMGSATPSLESWSNATVRGVSALHRLASRAPGLRVPDVQIVDFRADVARWPDRRIHLIGPTLEGAMRQALDAGGQVLLLLNRRGYANLVACPDRKCGWSLRCDHCDAGMVVHRADALASRMEFVRCHHCGTEQRLPRRCPSCSRATSVFGLGTQRVEEEVARLFPQLRTDQMARVDSDSMQGSGALHQMLGRFGSGELRLLMGTQMIAKGLDFPGVRVVGVVSADTSLNLPDFRASERTFQLVAQVAGRCGRGQDPGRAIIQTFQPDAPAIQAAARSDYEGFAAEELAARSRVGLPPARRMARIVVRHAEERRAHEEAVAQAASLRALPEAAGVDIRNPAPCPIARIADRWRVQIELLSDGPGGLQRLLAAARSRGVLRPGEQVAVDVDPVALL